MIEEDLKKMVWAVSYVIDIRSNTEAYSKKVVAENKTFNQEVAKLLAEGAIARANMEVRNLDEMMADRDWTDVRAVLGVKDEL